MPSPVSFNQTQDISTMECGHSAIRELTKLRGRGHIPTLAEVSAKSICRFVSKHHCHVDSSSEMPGEPGEGDAPPKTNKPKQGRRDHGRGGGGSAWNAFCAEQCRNEKFTRQRLRELSRAFRALSTEEYDRLKEVGKMMTIHNRHRRLRAASGSGQPTEGPADGTVAPVPDHCSRILAVPNPMFLLDGEDLTERFCSFKKILNSERKARRQADEAMRQPEDPTEPGSKDQTVSSHFIRAGGPGLLTGLRRSPVGSGPAALAVDHFRWKLPIIPFVRAALNLPARFEDELTTTAMENAWVELHELVQHSKQEPLSLGKGENFTVSACAKLGSCVCSPDGKAAAVMCHKLAAHMKKTHPGTHKNSTPERDRFVAKLCVLELCSEEVGLEKPLPGLPRESDESGHVTHLFLHCGYTNFTTWETTCTRLHVCLYNPLNGDTAFWKDQGRRALDGHRVKERERDR